MALFSIRKVDNATACFFEGLLEGLIQPLIKGGHEPSILRSFFKARFLAANIFFFRLMLGFS